MAARSSSWHHNASMRVHSNGNRAPRRISPHARRGEPPAMPTSIILPCRNDATALGRTLDHLDGLPGIGTAEVIVAASGDPDGTRRIIAGRARLLWPAGSTRAALMNAGAREARG